MDFLTINQTTEHLHLFDIRNQKVVFNLVGQYATNVTVILAEIRKPFKHIPKRIQ